MIFSIDDGDSPADEPTWCEPDPDLDSDLDAKLPGSARQVSTATTMGQDDPASDGRPPSSTGRPSSPSESQTQTPTPTPTPPPTPTHPLLPTEISAFLAALRATIETEQPVSDEGVGNSEQPASLLDRLQPPAAAAAAAAAPKAKKAKKAKNDFDTDSDEEEEQQQGSTTHQRLRLNLATLVEHLKAAEASLDQSNGQNVLLILGRTGVGKSSLVQRIAGRTFHRETYSYQVEDWDGEELKQVFEVDGEPLEGFEIGHESKSKTKSIHHLLLNSVYPGQKIVYLDSSGFEDTTGVEADIATSLSVKRVAERCQSLRFIVLVSCASFFDARGTAVRSLLDLVRSFVGGDWKKRRLAFTFLFTHTDRLDPSCSKSVGALRTLLLSHLKELGAHTKDDSTKAMIQWLDRCFRKELWGYADVFHPMDSDVQELREGLEKFEVQGEPGSEHYSAIGLAPSERCADVIKCGLTKESVSKIGVELRFLLGGVDGWLRGNEFSTLSKQLGVVALLYDQLQDVDEVELATQKIASKVRGHARQLLDRAYATMHFANSTIPVDATSISGALHDLSCVDVLVRQPLLSLPLKGDGEEGALEPDAAVKAVLHLADRLQDLTDHLASSPLGMSKAASALALREVGPGPRFAASSSLTGSASTSTDGSVDSGTNSSTELEDKHDESKNDKASPDAPRVSRSRDPDLDSFLFKPLPPETRAALEQLAVWSHGLSKSGGSPSAPLPVPAALLDRIERGHKLLADYVQGLLHVARDGESERSAFQSAVRRKMAALARLLELGMWLPMLPESYDGLVNQSELRLVSKRTQDELQELAGRLVDESLETLESAWQFLRLHIGSIDEIWEDGSMEAHLASVAEAIGKLSQFGTSVERKQVALSQLDDFFQRGLASLEQAADKLLLRLTAEGCSMLDATPEDGPFPGNLGALAKVLRAFSEAFPESDSAPLRARVKTEAALSEMLDRTDETIKNWRTKCAILWKGHEKQLTSEVAREVTRLLTSLSQAGWRDHFDPSPTLPSVLDIAAKLTRTCTTYIETASSKVLDSVICFLSAPSCPEAKDEAIEALMQVNVLQVLSEARQQSDEEEDSVEDSLRQHLALWEEKQLQTDFSTLTLPSALSPESLFAAELESVLVVSDTFGLLPEVQTRLADLHREAERRLAWLRREVEGLSGQVGHFEAKRQLLEALSTWTATQSAARGDQDEHKRKATAKSSCHPLLHVCRALPNFQELTEKFRAEISSASKRIQEELISAGRLEEAAVAIEELQPAQCLNVHLRGLISHELDSARQRLELTRTDFDQSLKAQIEACDFEGLGPRLRELLEAKTQGGKLLAKELSKTISARVEGEVSAAEANIRDGEKVVTSIRKLELAAFELQPVLGKLNLQKTVSSLKQHVANAFSGMLTDFKSALTSSNLPDLLRHQRSLLKYHRTAGHLLPSSAEREVRQALGSAAKCLTAAASQVQRFVDKLQLEPRLWVDTAPLIAALTKLKTLQESGSKADPSLCDHGTEVSIPNSAQSSGGSADLCPSISLKAVSAAYAHAVQTLSTCIQRLRSQCPVSTRDPLVLRQARCLYPYLIREFRKGLKDHLKLNFSLEEELEKAEAEYAARQARFATAPCSVEAVDDSWMPVLEWWAGLSTAVSNMVWWKKDAYLEDQQEMVKQAKATVSEALNALGAFDYRVCGSRCEVALRMKEHLTGLRLGKFSFQGHDQMLCSGISRHHNQLLEDLHTAIRKDNIFDLEVLFLRLHKFVKHLATSFPAILEGLPALHAHLAEHAAAKLADLTATCQRFDIQKAKRSVQKSRRFGQFLSGIYAMYAEMFRDDRDEALRKLDDICSSHFGGNTLLAYAPFYSVLEVTPNAQQEDIDRACRLRLKAIGDDPGAEAEREVVLQAGETLSDIRVRELYQRSLLEPFADMLRDLPLKMRTAVQESLEHSKYGQARDTMVSSRDLILISSLVEPPLNTETTVVAIQEDVKQHLEWITNKISLSWIKKDFKELNRMLERLEQVDSVFSAHSAVYSPEWNRKIRNDIAKSIETDAEDLCRIMARVLAGNEEMPLMYQMAERLLVVGRLMDDVPSCKEHASHNISFFLDKCQEELGPAFIFKLGMLLEQGRAGRRDNEGNIDEEEKRVAHVVLNSFQQFRDILTVIWNQQTAITQKDILPVLQEMQLFTVSADGGQSAMDTNVARLRQGFDAYSEAFDELLHIWKAGELKSQALVLNVKATVQKLLPCSVDNWTPQLRDALPELLASLAAYFTISKSGESFQRLAKTAEENGAEREDAELGAELVDLDATLQRPHPIQIVGLLRMFGYDSDGPALLRQVMQVRTGEGKSLILGMSSLLFGLLGFRVRCVCYSEYLSNRDYEYFQAMFDAFDVKPLVTYSKITTYSEDKIAESGDIRRLTAAMLKGQQETSHSAPPAAASSRSSSAGRTSPPPDKPATSASIDPTSRAKQAQEILLLDEVDMFFGADFYGRTHDQVATLEMEEVAEILQMIWRNRCQTRRQLLEDVKGSQQYKRLTDALKGFSFVVDQEVARMCQDVRRFSNPAYHCDPAGNRIGYKELDSVCYDIVCGYRTAFAYLHEADRKTFQNNDAALQRGLRLRVPCGQFCYNKIDPACILGVSGTVSALGVEQRQVLSKYNIDHYALLPSVYGVSNFKFLDQSGAEPVTIVRTRVEHFTAITELVKTMIAKKRAVIVLFQDAGLLREFEQSPYYSQIVNRAVLMEGQSFESKAFTIKKAATVGQLTCTTAVFGRGTDFLCNDHRLLEAGGVHIVQAFFSSETSEEVQIMGRTARQGKKGSYSQVLCELDLQSQFGLETGLVGKMPPNEAYEFLVAERAKLQRKKHGEIADSLREAERRDELTRAYFKALLDRQPAQSKKLFKELYAKVGEAHQHAWKEGNHVVFCLDGSTSMKGAPWDNLQRAFTGFLDARKGNADKISVIVFERVATKVVELEAWDTARTIAFPSPGGGTAFSPALQCVEGLLEEGAQQNLQPVLLFMSDGINEHDVDDPCSALRSLHQHYPDLQCHTIFFGTATGADQLKKMASSVPQGQFHHSVDGVALQETFKSIAIGAEYTK